MWRSRQAEAIYVDIHHFHDPREMEHQTYEWHVAFSHSIDVRMTHAGLAYG